MRPPRHRFSDEVRSTTRFMASEMVRDGTIARTPEELEAWIERYPAAREPLVRDGYGTAFTAEDLLPLLEAMVVKAGGSPPEATAPLRTSRTPWLIVFAAAVLAALLLFVVVGCSTGEAFHEPASRVDGAEAPTRR
jgi:hypothetical protein